MQHAVLAQWQSLQTYLKSVLFPPNIQDSSYIRPVEMKSQTYAEYVTAQSRQNPSLENLCHFLKRDTFTQPCRISCLEFNNESDSPSRKDLDIESLACLLSGNHETSDLSATMNRPKGRILIVEDLTRAIVEALGEALDIDPMFFASHIDGEKISADSSIPSMVQLPSQVKTRSFLTLRYHRVLKFGDEAAGLRRLESTGNILRKTMILPPNSANAYIGLAQRCCSVVMTSSQRAGWTGKFSSPKLKGANQLTYLRPDTC